MTKKRALLLMGVLGLVATAPTRVHASDGNEVEGATYGGTTAGGWICGPAGRVNYAGVAAHYRVATTTSRPGFYLGADAALGSVDLQCRLGQYRAGPSLFDDTSTRFDAVAYLPLTPHFDFRLGGSASGNDVGAGGEASLGLRAKL